MEMTCPTCQRSVSLTGTAREAYPQAPFCSERCRLLDLGAWTEEAYRVEGQDPAGQIDDEIGGLP